MKRILKFTVLCALFSFLSVFAFTGPAYSQKKFVSRTLCAYSPIGKQGPITNVINRYRAAAMKWGVRFDIKMYTDEVVALEDFQSGRCDAVSLGDVRTRELVKFGGGITQLGALPTFKHLRKAIATFSRKKAAKYLKNEKYEVVYFMPVGQVYLFFGGSFMSQIEGKLSVDDIAGERFGILGYDEQSRALAERLGATVVDSTISSLFGKFNNGSVDMIYSTPSAYKPLELHKGLGEEGRILKEPTIAMMSFNVTIHRDRFPKNFGIKSRKYGLSQFSFGKRLVMSYRSKVPQDYWLKPPKKMVNNIRNILKNLRQDLTEKGVYDPRLTKLFRNIRCNMNPSRAECA